LIFLCTFAHSILTRVYMSLEPKDMSPQEIIEQISDIIGPLTPDEKSLLQDRITIRQYKRNEIIYRDLDIADQIICLLDGKVKIFKDGIGHRNQIVRAIKPIEFFGYRACFAHEDYRTSAMALEPALTVSIPIEETEQLIRGNYHVAFFFINKLAKELGDSDDRIVSLTQKHIRGRLAEALLFLKKNFGTENDGYTLSIYLSREDLASLSNMTTSNAIRTLSSFVSEKIVVTDGRKIKILNDRELQKISEMG